jgi:hypothetical protein
VCLRGIAQRSEYSPWKNGRVYQNPLIQSVFSLSGTPTPHF